MLMKLKRESVARWGRAMLASGLTHGSGGNLSCIDRAHGRIAVSPTGVSCGDLAPEDVVVMDEDGRVIDGRLEPSSESAFHLALYRHREDIGAVVHTHSAHATAVACLERDLPPIHYLIGFVGNKVPLAPYATYGSEALARGILETIGRDYNGVLLAHHGVVTVGKDLETAFAASEAVEFVSRVYLLASAAGTPGSLSEAEMDRVIAKFKTYGRRQIRRG